MAKLNIDENQATPPEIRYRGIPTLMLFKNGNIEATKVGALSKSQLTAFIDSSHLNSANLIASLPKAESIDSPLLILALPHRFPNVF